MTESQTHFVQAPLLPTYAEIVHALRALDGEPVKRASEMITSIAQQTGTPQSPVDWSDPDQWIVDRLTGDSRSLARKIWESSDKSLNPRYLYGSYLFINKQRLSLPPKTEPLSLCQWEGLAWLGSGVWTRSV